MSNISELREMSDEQLSASLKEACQSLFRMRVQAQTERLDVPSELMRNRKTIARIKTIQTERQRAMENGSSATAADASSDAS